MRYGENPHQESALYSSQKNLDIKLAIELIRQSNGIPVIAHPGERTYSILAPTKGRNRENIPEILNELIGFGLLGLECIYPYHERVGIEDYFIKIANQFNLIVTGSRDFHGYHTHQKTEVFGSTAIDDGFLEHFKMFWE